MHLCQQCKQCIQHLHFQAVKAVKDEQVLQKAPLKGLGSDCISRAHSAIWGKLCTALQAYNLNPSTKFPPNPTSRKVNT